MNIVFSKVARFARIVQLNPRLILPLELLSASLIEPLWAPQYEE